MVEEEYVYDEEEEEEDRVLEQVENQQEIQDEVYGESPAMDKKDDLYSLFWKVVKSKESSKVGNLTDEELGMLDISVRDCQKIALLAQTLGHPGFAMWMMEQSEIVLATSASRSGWLPELFVSQRKFTTKTKENRGNIANLHPQQQPPKRGLFGRRK